MLALFAIGLVLGFFSIARLMKLLLKKFPRGTSWAIMGFVAGSIPALFFTDEFMSAPVDSIQIAVGALVCLAGVIASYALTAYAESRKRSA